MTKKNSSSLLDSGQAIGTYLDDLLQSSTENNPPMESLTTRTESPVDRLLDDLLQAGTEFIDSENKELPVKENSAPSQQKAADPVVENPLPKLQDKSVQQVTAAIEFPCQCMMFSIGLLKLAIPLIDLKAVHVTDEKLTLLPGRDALVEGILSYRDEQVKVIDSHRLFRQPANPEKSDKRYFLVLESCEWALTCDEVSDIETVEQGDLQFNSDAEKVIHGNLRSSLTGLLNIRNLKSLVLESTNP